MTDKVRPSLNAPGKSHELATTIAVAAASDGWIVPAGDVYLADEDADLNDTVLNEFAHVATNGLEVTIDAGEAFVKGAWVARDTQTTVSLAESTANQTVYLGWTSARDTVVIGLDAAFAADDRRIVMHEFDTDNQGVTSATDYRNLDDYRIGKQHIETHGKDEHDATVPDLDDNGKLLSSQIPDLAVTETHTVANESERLALDVQEGDVVIQDDEDQTYIFTGGDPSQTSDWSLILFPAPPVDTVFGRTGDITPQSGDYDHGQIANVQSSQHHVRPSAGNALADNGGQFDVQESQIDYGNLSGAPTFATENGSHSFTGQNGTFSHTFALSNAYDPDIFVPSVTGNAVDNDAQYWGGVRITNLNTDGAGNITGITVEYTTFSTVDGTLRYDILGAKV